MGAYRVTLPNDPSNLVRARVFLEASKLIKAKAGLDLLKVTEKDVAENPHKLVLTPIFGSCAGMCEERDGLDWAEGHILVEVLHPETNEPVEEGARSSACRACMADSMTC